MWIDDAAFDRIKQLAKKMVKQSYSTDAKERFRAAITADHLMVEIIKAGDESRYRGPDFLRDPALVDLAFGSHDL